MEVWSPKYMGYGHFKCGYAGCVVTLGMIQGGVVARYGNAWVCGHLRCGYTWGVVT